MTGLTKTNQIINYLDELFINPKCELNYNKDYELLLAVMLSAQTTDKRVNKVTEVLFNKYDSLDKLSDANINDLQYIIRQIGTFRKKSENIKQISKSLLLDKEGIVPNDRTYLESLPGVGRKTVNVVLANLYDEPLIAVDTHVERVSKRLGLAKKDDSVLVVEQKLNKKFPKKVLNRLHHQLVLFGRYYCKSQNPNCENCKIKNLCKYKHLTKKSR